MPVIRAVYTGTPASPIGGSIGMYVLPIVQTTDLVLPPIIDVRDLIAINIGPGGAIADRNVVAHVDLANIDWTIVGNTNTRKGRPCRNARTTVDARAIFYTWAITESWPHVAGQSFRSEWFPHSQKVSDIPRGRSRRNSGRHIEIWAITHIAGQCLGGAISPRKIGQPVARKSYCAASQIGDTWTCHRTLNLAR